MTAEPPDLAARLAADLAADGPPEREFHPGVAARMPTKRVSAGALIRDYRDRILTVRPTYKPTWDIPGGVSEAGEEPQVTCYREVAEEIGLVRPVGRPLVIDWAPAQGVWGDALHFVFDGGRIDESELPGLRLQPEEIGGVLLASLDEIAGHVRPSALRRLAAALDVARGGGLRYLRFGR